MERGRLSSGWISFQAPTALLPLETRRVDLTFKVLGPMGRLELLAFKEGTVQSLKTWENPVGTLTWSSEDSRWMPLDESGQFVFRVDAGLADVASTAQKMPDQDRPLREYNPNGERSNSSPSPVNSADTPLTYWQFEEISARITVAVPRSSSNTAAAAP